MGDSKYIISDRGTYHIVGPKDKSLCLMLPVAGKVQHDNHGTRLCIRCRLLQQTGATWGKRKGNMTKVYKTGIVTTEPTKNGGTNPEAQGKPKSYRKRVAELSKPKPKRMRMGKYRIKDMNIITLNEYDGSKHRSYDIEYPKVWALTGHRPYGLWPSNSGNCYTSARYNHLREFAKSIIETINQSIEEIRIGMAIGWDQAVAHACKDLGVTYDAYVPFEGQHTKWPTSTWDEYFELLNAARKVVVCSPGNYAAWKMAERNLRMLDGPLENPKPAARVLALWNGESRSIRKSGTSHTVAHASMRGYTVVNCWSMWEVVRKELLDERD